MLTRSWIFVSGRFLDVLILVPGVLLSSFLDSRAWAFPGRFDLNFWILVPSVLSSFLMQSTATRPIVAGTEVVADRDLRDQVF